MGKAPASFAPGKLPAVPLVIPPSLPGLGHSSPVRLWLQREDGWSLETRLCVCFLWLLVSFSFFWECLLLRLGVIVRPLCDSRAVGRDSPQTLSTERKRAKKSSAMASFDAFWLLIIAIVEACLSRAQTSETDR